LHRPAPVSIAAGLTCALLLALLGGVQPGQADRAGARRTFFWTVRQAESIAVVRGQPVHVKRCRGLGPARVRHSVRRYSRFGCTAGTGLDWERFDSVSVTYVLVPLGPWHGACSEHVLRNVRFVGGTGIP
jgi:hypothetical protein